MGKTAIPTETDASYSIPMDRLPRRYSWLAQWRDLLAAVQALHGLARAGLPMTHGLLLLSQDTPNRALFHVFYWMHRDMAGGLSLSEAMTNRPEFFPQFCIDLVEAGETSGQLAQVLEDLEESLGETYAFRRRVAGHMGMLWYSICPAWIAVAGFMLFITPQFDEFLGESEAEPGTLMAWLITANEAGVSLLVFIAAILLPGLWLAAEYSNLRRGLLAHMLGKGALAVPVLGTQRKKQHLAFGALILSRLLRAGVPLPHALRSAAAASDISTIQRRLDFLAVRIESGQSLGEAIEVGGRWYPRAFRTLVALGEESGRLPEALEQVAGLYQTQSRHAARLALEIGIPLSVCVAGLLVYVMYGGVFSTLTGLLTQLP